MDGFLAAVFMKLFHFFPLIAGFLIILLLLYFSDFSKVIFALKTSNKTILSLILLLFFLQFSFKCLRWKIEVLTIKPISYSLAIKSYASAFFLSSIFPFKALELLRGYFVKLKTPTNFPKTLSLVIFERTIDTLIYVLLSVLILLAPISFQFNFLMLLILFSIVFLSLALLFSKSFLNFCLILFSCFFKKHAKTIRKFAKEFQAGVKALAKSKLILFFLFLTFLIWGIEILIFFLALKSVGVSLSFIYLISIPFLSNLLGFLTSIPGGVGSTEAFMVLLLSLLKIDKSIAMASTLLYRFAVHFMEASLGSILFFKYYSLSLLAKVKRMRKLFA